MASRWLRFEPLEERQLLAVGPQLIGINPNEGELLQAGDVRHVAPQELTFRFDENQVIDPATLGGIQIVRSGLDGQFGNANDVVITPGYVGIGEQANEVVVRFAETLPDDLYRITIYGGGSMPLKNTSGQVFNGGVNKSLDFELDLGAQVIAVVPQPTSRSTGGALTQARDQIVVYFNNDDLYPTAVTTGQLATNPTVVDPQFYQLIFTNDTVTNTDDVVFTPTSIVYDPAADTAVLTFSSDLALLATGPGTYRLRIGNNEDLPEVPTTLAIGAAEDPGSSFDTAYELGTLGAQSQIIASAIEPESFLVEFPGSGEEPGHRDVDIDVHVGSADSTAGITTEYYNFRPDYGTDPLGNQLYNLITTAQKELARQVFDLLGQYMGVTFIESDSLGITIATGDMRASASWSYVIIDHSDDCDETFGGGWFTAAFRGISSLLGYDYTSSGPDAAFPGDYDILHGCYMYRPEGNDIDLFRFTVDQEGVFTAETFAERLADSSSLDTVISLYRNVGDSWELVSRNDDYYSEDSLVEMQLTPGTYAVGISASGNEQFDPTVEDTGLYGTSDGKYELRLNFRPIEQAVIVDSTGTALDGDGDGTPGGVYDFWFRTQTAARTLFVDKSAAGGATANGSLANPYRTLAAAFAAAQYGDVVRVVGNGGADGKLNTLTDNLPYLIGFDELGRALEDGATVKVPRGVTVMVDAGVIFKAQDGAIEVGSSAAGVDRSGGALQVLGTPVMPVYFTSYNNETIGKDTRPTVVQTPTAGDWGGIIFRNDLDRATAGRIDYEARGIFLNYVNHAQMSYGGGLVRIDSREQIVSPIQMVDARPTITFNLIHGSADAALSATPNSFEETNFHAPRYQTTVFTCDYSRVGPEVHGNILVDNTTNGLFIRIRTPAGDALRPLTVSARFDDTDVVHVLSENLVIDGTPGGGKYNERTGLVDARLDASLVIDPGTVVKLGGCHIRVEFGTQLIAEGVDGHPVVFTSLSDDTFGAGGTFDTTGDGGGSSPAAGDWGGIYFGHISSGSIDYARLRYGGGVTRLLSSYAGFNVIEIQQADVRITNSILEHNAGGTGGQAPADRFGFMSHNEAVIFVRGAQPVIVGNIIRHNAGPAININVNSLNHFILTDFGRSTGSADLIEAYGDNCGPLVRDNRLEDNSINGMQIRGGTLTTQSVWDDTDIVHVLFDEVVIPNLHTYGGLRLQSSPNESLVVKLSGAGAGFTASGSPSDISDRIGGMLHIIGQPGSPVVLTSLADDSVGAGVLQDGTLNTDTNNNGSATQPAPGDWRGVRIEEYSHDRNVAVYIEGESSDLNPPGSNSNPDQAEYIGSLASGENAGDDMLRLGFEIHGYLSDPADVDVYSFEATAGTEIWLDIDRTSQSLDTVIELIDRNGNVIARSDNSLDEGADPSLLVGSAFPMQKLPPLGGDDFFSINPKDAGMRVVLPGAAGTSGVYHVRVRSSSDNLDNLDAGETSGVYQLQIRLRELDEFAGSNVRYADIRYATNGIEVLGQPIHSPLLGEAAEDGTDNDTLEGAQDIGNFLQTDRCALSVAGSLASSGTDVDFYRFQVQGGSSSYVGTVFDIDYADGLARGDITLLIFDSAGQLILVSNDSNVADDLPRGESGDLENLAAGSLGPLDPFLGSVELPGGDYYVAVSAASQIAQELDQFVQADATNPLVRMEPLNSLVRIAEDHIGSYGGSTYEDPIVLELVTEEGIAPYALSDMLIFVSSPGQRGGTQLSAVNALTGVVEVTCGQHNRDVGDIVMSSGGSLYSLTLDVQDGDPQDAQSGTLLQVSPGDGSATELGDDGIVTYEQDEEDPELVVERDTGVQFLAMTIAQVGQQQRILAIGYRGDMDEQADPRQPRGVDYTENILYVLATNDGAAQYVPANNEERFAGAGTNAVERGVVRTEPVLVAAPGSDLADEMTFTINGVVFEFDDVTGGGSGVLTVPDGATMTDGLSFTLGGVVFEFDDQTAPGLTNAGATAIPYLPGDTADVIAIAVADTITGAVDPDSGITATAAGGTVALGGMSEPLEVPDPLVYEDNSGTVDPDAIAVEFTTADTAATVAQAIQDAINAAFAPEPGEEAAVTATARGRDIRITGLEELPGIDATPLEYLGEGPGGRITGMAVVGGELYAVSDTGGLWRIGSPATTDITVEYIGSSATDLLGIQFAGLSAGPDTVSEGRYADMLFGISTDGVIYAFNTDGVLMPVFLDGATSLETGLTDVSGLAFSTLEENLWHISGVRTNDAGHGIERPFDGSRVASQTAGDCVYFGTEIAGMGGGAATPGDYNSPGGSHGVLITEPFDLSEYDANDEPTLYFNYLALTSGVNYSTGQGGSPMLDSFRVYASAKTPDVSSLSGYAEDWHLLATNNSYERSDNGGEFVGDSYVDDVQELYDYAATDGSSWRQVRISLRQFAGCSDVRLRFEFSTAGSFNLGDFTTGGIELRTPAGSEILDGSILSFDTVDMEFDTGATLVLPAGSEINEGDTIMIDGPSSRVYFEYDSDGVVGNAVFVPSGPEVVDGDTFSITDGTTTRTFEFDCGYSILVPEAGGTAIGMYERFTINDNIGSNDVIFEFNKGGPPFGDVTIPITDDSTQDEVANAIVEAIAGTGLGLSPIYLGNGEVLVGGEMHTIDVSGVPALGLTGAPGAQHGGDVIGFLPVAEFDQAFMNSQIADAINNAGLNLTASASFIELVLEGEDAAFLPGTAPFVIVDNTAVNRTGGDSAASVAAQLMQYFETYAPEGVTPYLVDNYRINLFGATQVSVESAAIVLEGEPGTYYTDTVAITIHQGMTANEVAQAIAAALGPAFAGFNQQIACLAGSQIPADSSLTITDGSNTLTITFDASYADFTPEEVATAVALRVSNAGLELTVSTVGRRVNLSGKNLTVDLGATGFAVAEPTPAVSYGDIVHVIGHDVYSEGPMHVIYTLDGDSFGDYTSARRGQANEFQGIFIDDLIVGFAGRGEIVTVAGANTNFASNPLLRQNEILTGPYQLEIRRGSDYGYPTSGDIRFALTQSFDANDRLTQAISLIASSGAEILSGQSFTLGDGLNSVTFTFGDTGAGAGDVPETGDVIASAIETGLAAGSVGTYRAHSQIGDALDVDFFAFDLAAGDNITIDIDARDTGSSLDAALWLFDANGFGLAEDDLSAAPGEEIVYDAYLDYTVTASGRYYVGVSGYSNLFYDPNLADSGSTGTTGFYNIEILLNGGGGIPDAFTIPYSAAMTAAEVANAVAAAINREEVQAIISVEATSNPNGSRIDLWGGVTVMGAFAAVSLREPDDTISQAFDSGISPGGPAAFSGRGTIGDNTGGFSPGLDVDMIKVELSAGDTLYVDIDARDQGSSLDSMLVLFDASGTQLTYSDDTPAPGEESSLDSYLEYTATVGGTYYVGVSGYSNHYYNPNVAGSGSSGSTGSYNIEISRGASLGSGIRVVYSEWFGDTNLFRDQGQIIIESNFVTNCAQWGIVVDAGARAEPTDSPQSHPGAARVLPVLNNERLAPGTTVVNNVIAFNGSGGIRFSGDTTPTDGQDAPIPYGRILNNTIYGTRSGDVGIQISDNASPTVLNNILANLGTGLDIDASSQSSILGGMLFQNNATNSNAGLGGQYILLSSGDPLFVDAAAGNFYLAAGSKAIDSAVKSLEDRPAMIRVRDPLGISNAPVLAPESDVFGMYRGDDPNVKTPAGMGESVFIDRGAIDRVDFDGPRAELVGPADGDGDAFVQSNSSLTEFIIQIIDGGIGVADGSVDGSKVTVERNGVLLVEGQDYTYRYDETNDRIRLTAGPGVWATGTYRIVLNNSAVDGIKDLADNPLRANQDNGAAQFVIQLGGGADYGDAPDPTYPTLRPAGASHTIVPGFFLGYGVDADSNGEPSSGANTDAFDDGVRFDTVLYLTGQAQITVRASAAGYLDAWIDYNRNGTWEESERIFNARPLVNGLNTLTFSVPAGIAGQAGQSYARFRFSSTGGLAPDGAASSGEVEDYRVQLVAPHWQNPNNRFDVSGDGVLSARDALLLVNFLYFNGQQSLPTGPGTPPLPTEPPPYYDVSGDNFLGVQDALLVITALRNPPAPEGEGLADGAMSSSSVLVETLSPAVMVGGIVSAADPTLLGAVVSASATLSTSPSVGSGAIGNGAWGTAASESAAATIDTAFEEPAGGPTAGSSTLVGSAVDEIMAGGSVADEADLVDAMDLIDDDLPTSAAVSGSGLLDDFFAEFEECGELAGILVGSK